MTFPPQGGRWPEGPDEGVPVDGRRAELPCLTKGAVPCLPSQDPKRAGRPCRPAPSPGFYSMAMRLASGTTGTALGRFSSNTPLL